MQLGGVVASSHAKAAAAWLPKKLKPLSPGAQKFPVETHAQIPVHLFALVI